MANDKVEPVYASVLTDFCVRVFRKLGVTEEDAKITAEVLVAADLRGVDSHGVARLRRYVRGLNNGMMHLEPKIKVVSETPTTVLIDAGGGLGQPVSYRAMKQAIEKAGQYGVGFVTVRNSNHYGIAGYYAMMALDHDYIGLSMTNAGALVSPTFGRKAMLGTNPIAVAVPGEDELPFVLDMATSTVPRGKLEVYNRLGKSIPLGWAVDETGTPCTDPGRILDNFVNRTGGGLLPLGGAGELMGGHKGYGLAMLVEIFCAALSGSAFSYETYKVAPNDSPFPANVGHFFGAWRVDAFRPVDELKASMDELQRQMKSAPKAEGAERIYTHGEKEWETKALRSSKGIPLNPKVYEDLQAIAGEIGVSFFS
jgi:LDH2 family malate/lactate/ureidoglycolate dehydrogenase